MTRRGQPGAALTAGHCAAFALGLLLALLTIWVVHGVNHARLETTLLLAAWAFGLMELGLVWSCDVAAGLFGPSVRHVLMTAARVTLVLALLLVFGLGVVVAAGGPD